MLTGIEQSKVFHCMKCRVNTSGLDQDDEIWRGRQCPRCHSPLFQCHHCFQFTSGSMYGLIMACDSCKKITHFQT